jgi:site-specific DNA-cytosine methylase
VYGLVNAVEYGVPQDRTRFLCMGTRRDLWEINGSLGSLPEPECFSDRDLERIKLWTPQEVQLLRHAPGIRYFPDRPVLIPPHPCRNMHGDDIDPETGKRNGGRSRSFIEFYRRLHQAEPDRIVRQPTLGNDAPLPPRDHQWRTVREAVSSLPPLRPGIALQRGKAATAQAKKVRKTNRRKSEAAA